MNKQSEKRLLLPDVLPAFAIELQKLLETQGERQLAAQVPHLRIFGRCFCGDDFCSRFYTQPKPEGAYGSGHRNVRLFPDDGALLILDVVDAEIACVEVLDRQAVREKLLAAVPSTSPQSLGSAKSLGCCGGCVGSFANL